MRTRFNSFVFFAAELTVVGMLEAVAAVQGLSASLRTQQQAQRTSDQRAQHMMRASSLHVSALLSPAGERSCMLWLQRSRCVAEAAVQPGGDFCAFCLTQLQQQQHDHNTINEMLWHAEYNAGVPLYD